MSGLDADQPPQKRSRVSRACDQCRNGRERCDGAQPCHTCNVQRRQCSYHEQPKKRGIQPNYIRTLELTLAWLFQTFPEVESQLAAVLSDHSAEVPKLITGKESTRTENLHQVWRNGIISRQIDQALSGLSIEAFQQTNVANGGVSQSTASIAPKDGIVTTPHARAAPESVLSHLKDANTGMKMTEPYTKLKLPLDAWTLIEYYWAFTHTWLPIAEKASVLKVVYSYPPDGISLETASTAEHVELWSIMALAASQLANLGRRKDGATIRDTARGLLPSDYVMAGLGHVKALLLLALLDITNEKWLPAWLLVGSAIRLLFFDRGSCTLGHFVTGERLDHVCLAAFVLECSIAGVLRTSTHMRIESISTIGFINEEGLEEWSPWLNPLSNDSAVHAKAPARSCSTFNNVIRLSIYYLENRPRLSIAEKQFTTSSGHHTGTGFQLSRLPADVDSSLNPSSLAVENIVLILTRNASQATTSAQHPSAVVSVRMNSLYGLQNQPVASSMSTFPSPVQHRTLQNQPQRTSQSPYTADNNELPSANPTPSFWLHGTPTEMPISNANNGDIDGSTVAADIFEELAMLERKDVNQHPPQFMQNLGFAPDLDLAEFFGADYLPSDPMLAYMQHGLQTAESDDQRQDSG